MRVGYFGGNSSYILVFDCHHVDLYQNGRKVKSAKTKDNRAVFKLNYIPGTLEAVALDASGKELGRNQLVTANDDLRTVLRPEDREIRVGDIVYVNVTIEDGNGIVESNADRKLEVQVENGELLVFGSANPRLTEDIHSGSYTRITDMRWQSCAQHSPERSGCLLAAAALKSRL